MSIKSTVENVLKFCPPLFRLGSKVYHKFNGSFRTLSEGTPEAIKAAFEISLKDNDGSNSSNIGDYYEFGLFRGYAFLQAYNYSNELNIDNIHFYGFDSFEGLPEATGIDEADGRFFQGQFSCSKENVEKNLKLNGMDMSKTTLVEGFYSDSLTEQLREEHEFNKASVILMDCDLYSSTIEALTWVTPYIQNNTIILFDDWFSYGESDELGQQKAMQDFLEANPNFKSTELWNFSKNGKAFKLTV